MVKFIDTSSWQDRPQYNTGGTRDKKVLYNPANNELYFFKTSLLKPGREYIYEYWSEIIASQIGSTLGFNTLHYDIAKYKDQMGCLSKLMVSEGKNRLTEGISYLTGFDNTYNPLNKRSYPEYTFQLIIRALKHYELEEYVVDIVKIIVFDSIIGNGDRHQENWGVISEYQEGVDIYTQISNDKQYNIISRQIIKLFTYILRNSDKMIERYKLKFHSLIPSNFAPIYDNGSCLGRELLDNKVDSMLSDPTLIRKYINKGKSEIHWKGRKLKHFDLIRKLMNDYSNVLLDQFKEIERNYSDEVIKQIVEDIDSNLPKSLANHKVPSKRKELIIKA